MDLTTFQIPGFDHLTAGSVYCIGRNYAKHARELNNPVPDEPVVFLKPRSSLLFKNDEVIIPAQSNSVHHEVEMVLLIGEQAKNISASDALQMIEAVAIGIDFTARDIQQKAKEKGLPWSIAKGFDSFAPVGNFVSVLEVTNLNNLSIQLSKNGNIVQQGNTKEMIFSVEKIIEYISSIFTLYPGDLLFTGTPEGVGPVKRGDIIKAELGNQMSGLNIHVSN